MQGLRPLQRYFEFSGRSGRAEYWQWILLTAAAGMLIRAVESVSNNEYDSGRHMVSLLFTAATFIPNCAAVFRRLHDRGKSGWLYGILLVAGGIDAGLYFWADARYRVGDQGPLGIFVTCLALSLAWCIYLVVLLALPGDPGVNAYGQPDTGDTTGQPVASSPPRYPTTPSTPSAGSVSSAPTDQTFAALERLGQLKAQGVLSEEEFAEQKRRVLGIN